MRTQRFQTLSLAITASAILISVLQGAFFALQGLWTTYTPVAIFLAAANLLTAIRFLATKDTRLFWLVLILYSAQIGIFVVKFINTEPPFPFRLLQVAIILSYSAAVMSVLLTGLKVISPSRAVLLSFSLAIAILLCEIILGLLNYAPYRKTLGTTEWVGQVDSHPSLGEVYAPYSTIKIYYPDNPRGYFEEEDSRESRWQLHVARDNKANLVFPPNDPDLVRIDIRKAETQTSSDIQLNQPHLKVKSNHHYTINFRARADQPRNIFAGFARAHDSWTGLGFFRKIGLTPEWQSFQEDFIATADDDNARIHFDVGGSGIPVEFSSVGLRSLPDGKPIEPEIPSKKYFVRNSFNALGCRDRDYPIPRPGGTTRILILGDSFTMGVGVKEEDTIAKKLESLLNNEADTTASKRSYEVINCGVSGYGTHEERLFYQLFGEKYEPDVVLLVMIWNDDMSYLEEVQKGYVRRHPGKLELLFHTWGKIQKYRHRRPFPNFSKCVDEILKLNNAIAKQGARLGVVIFRDYCDYGSSTNASKIWNHITDTVTKGLADTDIPILDLGKALCEKHSDEDLRVHQIDPHPNEIAHAIAAQEIEGFLRKENLLSQ
jgi:hypothetical protein